MTRFRYFTAATLDGFLADDHDSLDWLLTQPIDEDGPMNYAAFIGEVGAIAMGSTTYDWVVAHEAAQDGPPWPYDLPCFLFSRTGRTPVAESIQLIAGPPAEHREALVAAAAGKDVWIVGGGDLAAQFAEAGVLDEMIVTIAPVTLGSGRPLFPRPFDLELLEVDRNQGFVCTRYAVRGPRNTQSPTD